MEGLKECEANLVVYLHPSKAKTASDAITELSSLLFTYSEAFEGVVLAYDPNICGNLAKILPGIYPYFGVKLKARLLLFNPMPDMLLEGEVVKVTPQSIHAVILGFSSVFIADEDIRDDFKHKIKRGKEVYVSQSHKKHKIKVGNIVRFVVKSFDEEILHISGSLVADNTGSAQWLDKNLDEWAKADSSTRKKKIVEGKGERPEGDDRSIIKRQASSLKDDSWLKRQRKEEKVRS